MYVTIHSRDTRQKYGRNCLATYQSLQYDIKCNMRNNHFNYHFSYTDYHTIKCNKEKYVKCNNRMQGVLKTDQSVLSGLHLDQVLLPSSYQLSTFHVVGLSRSLTRTSLSHAESQDLESCQQTREFTLSYFCNT